MLISSLISESVAVLNLLMLWCVVVPPMRRHLVRGEGYDESTGEVESWRLPCELGRPYKKRPEFGEENCWKIMGVADYDLSLISNFNARPSMYGTNKVTAICICHDPLRIVAFQAWFDKSSQASHVWRGSLNFSFPIARVCRSNRRTPLLKTVHCPRGHEGYYLPWKCLHLSTRGYQGREVRWNSVSRETVASRVCHKISNGRYNCRYGLPLFYAKCCFI